MKKIKYVLIGFLGMIAFSCQDAIDIVQPGENDLPTAFQNVNDLQQGLNGLYGFLRIETQINHASIWTDEVRIGVASGGQGLTNDNEFGFALNPNSGYANSIWQSKYTVINVANRIIEASKVITVKPGEEDAVKYILAQAHIIRAWGHFDLLSYYSEDITNPNALGVILMDRVPTLSETSSRSTNKEVFDLIESDLEKVNDLDAGYFNYNNTDNTYISPNFVTALRARMYAYKGEYDKALPYAQELIDQVGLTTRANYSKIFTDSPIAGVNEVIFKLLRVSGDSTIGSIWNSQNATVSGAPIYEVSTDLFNLLNTSSDVRFNVVVSPTGAPNYTVRPVAKYTSKLQIPLLSDLKVFRTSKMVFIKAEALAEADDLEGVAQTLQLINAKRFSSPNPVITTPATKEAAFAEILKQRRIELCFEGHRYQDFKRLGAKAGINLERNPADCAVNNACFLSNTDYRLVFPIPQIENTANVKIRSQQNPGY